MKIVVVGASSQIGHFLLPRLVRAGHQIFALSRTVQPAQPSIRWVQADLCDLDLVLPDADAWIHAGPLPLLPPVLEKLTKYNRLRRVVAFSSTSRLSKIDSDDSAEAKKARSLAEAEEALATICESRGIDWTIFRPTLIYGCQKDKNVTFVVRFIRRFRFYPIVGKGEGLRQPVHADDLAMACLRALDSSASRGRIYELSGRQTLSYRAMIEAIFHATGLKVRIVQVPQFLLCLGLYALKIMPRFRHLNPAMITRMSTDLCFEHDSAHRDFGYNPRTFEPNFNN